MRRILTAALSAAALLAFAAPAHARTLYVTSTAYSWGCGASGPMANGARPYIGAVAMNMLPLGRRIRVSRSPTGLRWHTVADRIGYGTQLDFFVGSCWLARAWGRRTVRVTY